MDTPTCLECGKPVTPVRSRLGRPPKRGWRRAHGQTWHWFCSRRCVGIEVGRRNVTEGLLERSLFLAARGRYRQMNARRQAFFAEEAASLTRYGVPRDLAVATLDRVWQLARKREMDRQALQRKAK